LNCSARANVDATMPTPMPRDSLCSHYVIPVVCRAPLPSAKVLLCATHGKAHSATNHTAKHSLPIVFYRALGKPLLCVKKTKKALGNM